MTNFADPEIYREVIEHLPTAVYFVDADEKIRFWNEGAEKITGYLRQDVVGHFCRENILSPRAAQDSPPGTEDGQRAASTPALAHEPGRRTASRSIPLLTESPFSAALRDGRVTESEVFLHHKAGHRIPVRLRAIPIRNEHGAVIGVAETFEASLETTEWDRRQHKLSAYGAIDEITGVLNHAVVQSHLRENLATFEEHGVPVSILLMKVDQADHLRATYGPQAIVAALRATAQMLEGAIRPTDFLGRWDDHRLLLILPECSRFDVPRVAEKLNERGGLTGIRWWGDEVPITLSLGGATALHGETMEELLARAAAALEEALAQGSSQALIRD